MNAGNNSSQRTNAVVTNNELQLLARCFIYMACFTSMLFNVYYMCVAHLWYSSDRPLTMHSNITLLGTVTPAPADVGLNLNDDGYHKYIIHMKD